MAKKIKNVNITLFNRLEKFATLLFNSKYKISFENKFDTLIINLDTVKLSFDGWWLGDIYSSFEEVYKVPVENKIVIDIGSNIADTAVSFIYRGASKVIALEPFPINYEFAERNIVKNRMHDKIANLLGGCASQSSEITIDPNLSGLGYQMKLKENGKKVMQYSLEELVKKYNIIHGILKMNCEGCEYDSIINSTNTILQKFSHIVIQYHGKPTSLMKKLSDAGFETSLLEYSENKGQILGKRS